MKKGMVKMLKLNKCYTVAAAIVLYWLGAGSRGDSHLQDFLMVVFFVAVGFSLRRIRDDGKTTSLWRISTLVALTLFCIGLGAILCQIAVTAGLPLPLFVCSMAMAVLVRNCSELANEFPDNEADIMGAVSLGIFATFTILA